MANSPPRTLAVYHRSMLGVQQDPYARGGLLLDVRSPAEQRQGVLPGAIPAPIDTFPGVIPEIAFLAGLPFPLRHRVEGRPVLVYCKRGIRAEKATRMLQQSGFPRVCNIGGIEVEPLRSIYQALQATNHDPVRWARYGEEQYAVCRRRWLESGDPDALIGMYRHAYGAELNWLDARTNGSAGSAHYWGQKRAQVRDELLARLQD